MSVRTDTASPRTTTSMSFVMRCTPCAMTAIPPITIHGGSNLASARVSAISAVSMRDRSPPRTGVFLDPSPAVADFLDGMLAHRVARSGPSAHGLERRECGEQLGHCPVRARTLSGLQCALQLRGRALTSEPTSNGMFLAFDVPSGSPVILASCLGSAFAELHQRLSRRSPESGLPILRRTRARRKSFFGGFLFAGRGLRRARRHRARMLPQATDRTP